MILSCQISLSISWEKAPRYVVRQLAHAAEAHRPGATSERSDGVACYNITVYSRPMSGRFNPLDLGLGVRLLLAGAAAAVTWAAVWWALSG